MRNYIIAAVAAVALAAPANALTVTYSPTFGFPPVVTPVTFQTYGTGATNQSPFTPGSGTVVGATTYTESVSGVVTLNSGSVPGQAVDPDASGNGNYLAVENGSYTVSFSTPLQFFSFIFGSLDNYNTLTLNFASGPSLVLRGTQILSGLTSDPIGPFNSTVNGRVSYDTQGGFGITSAVFSSAQQAFEIDGLAGAVPEPAAWGMMIIGFGAAGYALRVRRRKTGLATA